MTTTATRWARGELRAETGIFYANDEFVELCGSPCGGYRPDLRSSATPMFTAHPSAWCRAEPLCTAETAEWRVVAGGSDCEGAFVALEERSPSRLHWILHLAGADAFAEVTIVAAHIVATSGDDGGIALNWRIPLDAPEELTAEPAAGA